MSKAESIQRAVGRSRRVPILIIGLTVMVVAATIGLTTRQVRAGIREQMVGRDAAVLHAVLTTHLDEQRSLDPLGQDPANQLTAVLVASRLKGVLGTRLFDPQGRLLEVFPPLVRESELLTTNLAVLQGLQATGYFLGATAPDEVFYSGEARGTGEGSLPLFVVEVPLHTTSDQVLLGIAQFLIEGHTIQTELARLDRQLAYQALATFGAASLVLTGSLGWAFRRLRRTHALLADKTRHLERANDELARAVRTAAVGAITAHLIHGLRSPLTGLQHFVTSLGDNDNNPRSVDWETAVRTTRRMQSLISEVVEVLREENTDSCYELSVGELIEWVNRRVIPLAVSRGVKLESAGDPAPLLTNRTANLLKLILVNLTENAIHATPAGKCVRIATERAADSLRFLVSDEGPGFPEPTRANVFSPRPSGREGGAGIGLAISKQLADYLGAELELRQSTVCGCVFALGLRLDAWERATAAPRATPRPAGLGAGRPHGRAALLLLALVSSSGVAENHLRWRWSNPTPHGNNILDMAYSAELGMAVQVTERGRIYSSRDLDVWIPRESNTRNALRAAAFLGRRLVVTGEAGTVLYADSLTEIRPGTLLEGATTDWFEGCAASASLAVAVGDQGAIYSTIDGIQWRRQSSGTTSWLRGAAHGAGVFVAVGETGTILTSADGATWTAVASGTSIHLNRVAFLGDAFVSVGDGGVVLSSPDGTNWVSQSSNATGDLLGVGSSENTQWVTGDGELRRFETGTWIDELTGASGPPPWLYYSALGGPGEMLVAGQTGLMVRAQRREPGQWDWQLHSPSVRSWLFDMAHVPSIFVAVGDRGTVMSSSGGVDWELEIVPNSLTNAVLLGVGGSSNLLIAAGNQGSLMISPNTLTPTLWTNESGAVLTQEVSTLGIVWHAVEPRPATNDLQGVTFHDGRYYVSGDRGLVLSTADGTNWVRHPTPAEQLLSGITGFPGGLVATGDDGAMVFSADGVQWVALPTLTTNWLFRVRYLNGTLFAVGQAGTIYQSANGIDWQPRESGVTTWLNDVSWVDGHYYIAGTQGTVLASGDGLSWSNEGTITPKSLFALATNGAYLLAAGVEGVILRSPIIPDLTPVTILEFSRVFTEGATAYQNLFLLGGRVDQRFTFDYRQLLGDGAWQTGPEIEFTDSSGTLYYIETVPATNAATSEYYRATLVP